jgi:phosphoribosylpyrophosphate synthetase
VLVTDTLAGTGSPSVEVRSVASLLAGAIRRLHHGEPLGDLLHT